MAEAKYFKLLNHHNSKFIGNMPITLNSNNIKNVLDSKDSWYFLLKYDGERRVILFDSGNVYFIDRNNTFTSHKLKIPKALPTIILDAEVFFNKNGVVSGVKAFDILYYDPLGAIMNRTFVERMKLLHSVTKSTMLSKELWFNVSYPYHLSELQKALTTTGEFLSKWNGFDTDGIILMKDVAYRSGASNNVMKYKNLIDQTIDMKMIKQQTVVKKKLFGVNLKIATRSKSKQKTIEYTFAQTYITYLDITRLNIDIKKDQIYEFEYNFTPEILPLQTTKDFKESDVSSNSFILDQLKTTKMIPLGEGILQKRGLNNFLLKAKVTSSAINLIDSSGKVHATLSTNEKYQSDDLVICTIIPPCFKPRYLRKDKILPNAKPTAEGVWDFIQKPIKPIEILKWYKKETRGKFDKESFLKNNKDIKLTSVPINKNKINKTRKNTSPRSAPARIKYQKAVKKPTPNSILPNLRAGTSTNLDIIKNLSTILTKYHTEKQSIKNNESQFVELEFKLGTNKNGRYQNGISQEAYIKLKRHLDKHFKEISNVESVDKQFVLPDSTRIRETTTQSNKKEYIIKTKMSIPDTTYDLEKSYKIKPSLSIEESIPTTKGTSLIKNLQPTFIRNKKRTTYQYPNDNGQFKMDLTEINNNRWEFEIEMFPLNLLKTNLSQLRNNLNDLLNKISNILVVSTHGKKKVNFNGTPPNINKVPINRINVNSKKDTISERGYYDIESSVLELAQVLEKNKSSQLQFSLGVSKKQQFVEGIYEKHFENIYKFFNSKSAKNDFEVKITDSKSKNELRTVIDTTNNNSMIRIGEKFVLRPFITTNNKSNGTEFVGTYQGLFATQKSGLFTILLEKIKRGNNTQYMLKLILNSNSQKNLSNKNIINFTEGDLNPHFPKLFVKTVQTMLSIINHGVQHVGKIQFPKLSPKKQKVQRAEFERAYYEWNKIGYNITNARQRAIRRGAITIQTYGSNARISQSIINVAKNYWQSVFNVDRLQGGIVKGQALDPIYYACLYVALIDSHVVMSLAAFRKQYLYFGPHKNALGKNIKVTKRLETHYKMKLPQLRKAFKLVQTYVQKGENIPQNKMNVNQAIDILVKLNEETLGIYKGKYKILENELKPFLNHTDLLDIQCNNLIIICIYLSIRFRSLKLENLLKQLNISRDKNIISKCNTKMKKLVQEYNVSLPQQIPRNSNGAILNNKPNPCPCQCDLPGVVQVSKQGKYFIVNKKGAKIYCTRRGGPLTKGCRKMCPSIQSPKIQTNNNKKTQNNTVNTTKQNNKVTKTNTNNVPMNTHSKNNNNKKVNKQYQQQPYVISTITANTGDNRSIKSLVGDRTIQGMKRLGHVKYQLEKLKADMQKDSQLKIYIQKKMSNMKLNEYPRVDSLISRSIEIAQLSDGQTGIKDFKDLIMYLNIFKVINFGQLYSNFKNDSNFICIRLTGVGEKSFTGKTCTAKKGKQANAKLISNYENFQNQIELQVDFGKTENKTKLYNVKVYTNGKINITGCKDPKLCSEVAKMVITKINDTSGAVTKSEYSELIKPLPNLNVTNYSKLIISTIMSNAKTNLKLIKDQNDPSGLRKVYNLLTQKYKNILPNKTHNALRKDNMPIRLNHHELKTGKTLFLKMQAPNSSSLISVALQSSGTINVYARTIEYTNYVYNTLSNIFSKHFNNISQ